MGDYFKKKVILYLIAFNLCILSSCILRITFRLTDKIDVFGQFGVFILSVILFSLLLLSLEHKLTKRTDATLFLLFMTIFVSAHVAFTEALLYYDTSSTAVRTMQIINENWLFHFRYPYPVSYIINAMLGEFAGTFVLENQIFFTICIYTMLFFILKFAGKTITGSTLVLIGIVLLVPNDYDPEYTPRSLGLLLVYASFILTYIVMSSSDKKKIRELSFINLILFFVSFYTHLFSAVMVLVLLLMTSYTYLKGLSEKKLTGMSKNVKAIIGVSLASAVFILIVFLNSYSSSYIGNTEYVKEISEKIWSVVSSGNPIEVIMSFSDSWHGNTYEFFLQSIFGSDINTPFFIFNSLIRRLILFTIFFFGIICGIFSRKRHPMLFKTLMANIFLTISVIVFVGPWWSRFTSFMHLICGIFIFNEGRAFIDRSKIILNSIKNRLPESIKEKYKKFYEYLYIKLNSKNFRALKKSLLLSANLRKRVQSDKAIAFTLFMIIFVPVILFTNIHTNINTSLFLKRYIEPVNFLAENFSWDELNDNVSHISDTSQIYIYYGYMPEFRTHTINRFYHKSDASILSATQYSKTNYTVHGITLRYNVGPDSNGTYNDFPGIEGRLEGRPVIYDNGFHKIYVMGGFT